MSTSDVKDTQQVAPVMLRLHTNYPNTYSFVANQLGSFAWPFLYKNQQRNQHSHVTADILSLFFLKKSLQKSVKGLWTIQMATEPDHTNGNRTRHKTLEKNKPLLLHLFLRVLWKIQHGCYVACTDTFRAAILWHYLDAAGFLRSFARETGRGTIPSSSWIAIITY